MISRMQNPHTRCVEGFLLCICKKKNGHICSEICPLVLFLIIKDHCAVWRRSFCLSQRAWFLRFLRIAWCSVLLHLWITMLIWWTKHFFCAASWQATYEKLRNCSTLLSYTAFVYMTIFMRTLYYLCTYYIIFIWSKNFHKMWFVVAAPHRELYFCVVKFIDQKQLSLDEGF